MENNNLPTSLMYSHHPPLISSFPLKRKQEVFEHQNVHPPPKIYRTRQPSKWQPPQKRTGQAEVNELTVARTKPREPQTKVSPPHETGIVLEEPKDQCAPKSIQQIQQKEEEGRCCESATNALKQTPSSVTCQPLQRKQAKRVPDQKISGPKMSREKAKPRNQRTASCLTATLASDPRVKDCGKMNPDEKMEMLEKARRAKLLVLTAVYRDGTTQLDPEQVTELTVTLKTENHVGLPVRQSRSKILFPTPTAFSCYFPVLIHHAEAHFTSMWPPHADQEEQSWLQHSRGLTRAKQQSGLLKTRTQTSEQGALYEVSVCEFTVYSKVLSCSCNVVCAFVFVEICCYKCCPDLNWLFAIKPKICSVQLCSFTDKTSAGNKAVHRQIHTSV